MKIIGLTGQTGAGKTTVCAALSDAGFVCIDCDQISRDVTVSGTACLAELADCFGPEILLPDGSLNRRTLGALVFSDAAQRHRLEDIIFPYILSELKRRIHTLEKSGVSGVIVDAPTLYESGADHLCGAVIAVIAPESVRLERILQRDGLTLEAARHRIAAQHPDSFYTERANYVIQNHGTMEELADQARNLACRLAL